MAVVAAVAIGTMRELPAEAAWEAVAATHVVLAAMAAEVVREAVVANNMLSQMGGADGAALAHDLMARTWIQATTGEGAEMTLGAVVTKAVAAEGMAAEMAQIEVAQMEAAEREVAQMEEVQRVVVAQM
mmetsp:Transcript_11158/g.18689  ORF Transcript_11158/g.18689 Transcript_11158/m.18689 type:complete len:129 (+) Transcript_11158:758-1144(+)